MNCWVGASRWLAWCYKAVYIHIGSVYYFLKIWMDIVELYLLTTFWTSILVSILYCGYNNCVGWIVVLEQVGSLDGVIRWFQLILGVFIKIWKDIVELCLLIATCFFQILISILFLWLWYLYWGGLLSCNKWVACMVL